MPRINSKRELSDIAVKCGEYYFVNTSADQDIGVQMKANSRERFVEDFICKRQREGRDFDESVKLMELSLLSVIAEEFANVHELLEDIRDVLAISSEEEIEIKGGANEQ